MKKLKQIIGTIVGLASLVWVIFFALRKTKPTSIQPELDKLNKDERDTKAELKKLKEQRENLKVEDKTLQEEVDYWNKQ